MRPRTANWRGADGAGSGPSAWTGTPRERRPGAGRSPGSPVLDARLPIAFTFRRSDSGAVDVPHWPTVAGAAAAWRDESRGTAFPFHPPHGNVRRTPAAR